jgi:L-threonylcarbamoyladenylate synthase
MLNRAVITHYLKVDPNQPNETGAIEQAAGVIRAGGLVAFPTETVYGLGANATDAEAVVKIYDAKQRALNDPLIVHCALGVTERQNPVAALAGWQIIGELSARQAQQATALIRQFWPGPLTLVLPRGARIPTDATAGLDTVAVRMPNHPVALALIERSGVPIAAPSANRFGHVSPTTARHVLDDLDGRIDLVLDGGPAHIGVESTVLDLTADQPAILRPGGVAREEIERVVGRLGEEEQRGRGDAEAQASPGMLSKHYAPRAALRVVRDTGEMLRARAAQVERGARVGLLLMAAQQEACAELMPQFVLGDSLADAARNLYAGLRALDGAGVDVILVAEVERSGLGEAIADRLRRAAA